MGLKWVHKKYSDKNKGDGQQIIWYQEQTIQSIIWDFLYTEPMLSIINYNNLIMTTTHSSNWWNNKKKGWNNNFFTCFSFKKKEKNKSAIGCDMSTWVWVRNYYPAPYSSSLCLSQQQSIITAVTICSAGWVYQNRVPMPWAQFPFIDVAFMGVYPKNDHKLKVSSELQKN